MTIKLNPGALAALRLTPAIGAPIKQTKESLPVNSGSNAVRVTPVATVNQANRLSQTYFSPLMTGLGDWTQSLSGSSSSDVAVTPSSEPSKPATYAGTFSLRIKTREGDTVTLHFGESHSVGDELEKSTAARYEVEGDLSDAERKALDKVVEKMVDITETFFSSTIGFGRMAIMDDLSFFDAEQLASFALDVSQARQFTGAAHQTYSSMSLDYSVDLKNKRHHLASEFVMGYSQPGQAGQQRFSYDLTAAIDPLANSVLNALDVRDLGKPGLHQSAPTALPNYYQGALQALASQTSQLAALVDRSETQQVAAKPKDFVVNLFRAMVKHHPAYKNASEPMRRNLDGMLDMLPKLMEYSQAMAATFLNSLVSIKA